MKLRPNSAMWKSMLTALLLWACTQAAVAQLRTPPTAAPACPSGTRLCRGSFGFQCYSPASGQVCHNGAVCDATQQLCSGPYGSSCYAPSQGQQCLQGVICQQGQSICTKGGIPHCYSPASGEQCQ